MPINDKPNDLPKSAQIQPAAATDSPLATPDTGAPAAPVAIGIGESALLFLSLLLAAGIIGGSASLLVSMIGLEFAGHFGAAWFTSSSVAAQGFNGGFTIAGDLTVAGVAAGTVGAAIESRKGWRTPHLVGFSWLAWFLVAGIGAEYLRRRHGVELPRVEASGILLGVQALAVGLPLYCGWLVLRGAAGLWRAARRSALVAGVVIGGCLAGSGAVWVADRAFELGGGGASLQSKPSAVVLLGKILEKSSDNESFAHVTQLWFTSIAAKDAAAQPVLPRAQGGNASQQPKLLSHDLAIEVAGKRFSYCFEQLLDKSNGRSAVDQAISFLRSDARVSRDAEDLAYETVLRVCQRYSTNAIENLRPYYFGALKNMRETLARSPYAQWCELDGDIDRHARYDTELGTADLKRDFERCYCKLSGDQRKTFKLRFEGHEFQEIAGNLNKNSDAIRQIHSRAERALLECLNIVR